MGRTRKERDEAEQFYWKYRKLICRTANQLCQSAEERDELVQDSLLRFLKNLSYYITDRTPNETAALVVLTVQCQKIDTWRKLHPEKWVDMTDEAVVQMLSLEPPDAFRRTEIHMLLDKLPPTDRYLLKAYYLVGMSVSELANTLRISTAAVHMRLRRARERAAEIWNLSFEEVLK